MMDIDCKNFRAGQGEKADLKRRPTLIKPLYHSKEEARQILEDHIKQLSHRQSILYAHNRYSLLVIFQAMDAAGKDSAIKHVMTGVNPQGCQVISFKHPSDQELEHDFLWRGVCNLPERGHIGIFNRSYYEEVLIVRVRPEILQAEKMPDETSKDKHVWQKRFESIRGLEKHLHRNGTKIVKIFLHLSKEEQRRRFLKRIDEPQKNWKFSMDDLAQRKHWKHYMQAYEDCMGETGTQHAPWHIVPADDKDNAHIIISQIILDNLRELHVDYPKLSPSRVRELKAMRKHLQ